MSPWERDRVLAECQRKGERRAREIIHLMDKNARLAHEIKRLEKVLAWVHRTTLDVPAEVRDVVEKTIPKRCKTSS